MDKTGRTVLSTRQPDGFCCGDLVVEKGREPQVVMSVQGMRSAEGGRSVLCTWTEGDGQGYHEWIPERALEMARGVRQVPGTDAYLKHVRCGTPVSIASLSHDVALYVWCEHCKDLVEAGELHPEVDETAVRLRVNRERVRPVHPDDKLGTETVEVPE